MLPATIALLSTMVPAADPPPFGALPSKAQLAWHEMEFYGFLHFTVNTFTDREWGQGDEPESVFNPTDFNADQIALVAAKSGMKGLILTAKHHDGFCLWPTKTTGHNVTKTPFKRDVVKLISEACKRHGLKFGIYLSPWDRNNSHYGRPEYIHIYREQLRELLTNYGPIYEVWHDGANGGDGYYGGAKESRKIDPTTYYDWRNTWALVRQLQPKAVIFSDIGPDVRWVGNESGYAGDPCWATYSPKGPQPGTVAAPGFSHFQDGENGTLHGEKWLPAECDVSIRPGWFWHETENDKVKTAEQLKELYFKSVGRGASFLLNIPPDRHGQIHPVDEKALVAFRKLIADAFSHDLARKAKTTSNGDWSTRSRHSPKNTIDGDRVTFWAAKSGTVSPTITFSFNHPVEFNLIRVREAISLGQCVESLRIDAWLGGKWEQVASTTSIGNCRLLQIEPVKTTRVRLVVDKYNGHVALSEIALFLDPNEAP